MKIKYIAYVAASIDGRIAKNNNSGTDWTSKEDWNFFQKSLKTTDAVIVGRNTFKVAESRLKLRNTVVLTSRVKKPKVSGLVTFLNPHISNLKNFLETKGYKKVAILGGPKVYDFCLRNKVLDELFVTIEPYIFTAGIVMFSGTTFTKYRFILRSVKKINKKGTLLLKYVYANQRS